MGQCCNFQAAAHDRHDSGVASDCNLEQPSDEMELADNLTDVHPPGLPLPNRMHGFVTLDRAVGSRMVKELDLLESNHGCGLNGLSREKHFKTHVTQRYTVQT